MKASIQHRRRMLSLIKRQRAGNLSITEFCKKHKIHKWTFWYWRKKLKGPNHGSTQETSSKEKKQMSFFPVVSAPIARVPVTGDKVEVHFPSGITITFPASIDPDRFSSFIESQRG